MQDWITIRGASGASVTMSQSDWVLTAPFQDISFYLDVREASGGTITLKYETSPSRDEALFQPMASVSVTGVVNTVTSVVAAYSGTYIPVSHWSRWTLAGPASTWDITFRIMATGNSIC